MFKINYETWSTKSLMQAYENLFGLQGDYIYNLTRSEITIAVGTRMPNAKATARKNSWYKRQK